MADLPIIEFAPASPIGGAWVSKLTLAEGTEKFELGVEFSDTQRWIAGLIEPTPDWIVERTCVCAPLLDNLHRVLEQVRGWEQPLRLLAGG
jgi:hypothetical protein